MNATVVAVVAVAVAARHVQGAPKRRRRRCRLAKQRYKRCVWGSQHPRKSHPVAIPRPPVFRERAPVARSRPAPVPPRCVAPAARPRRPQYRRHVADEEGGDRGGRGSGKECPRREAVQDGRRGGEAGHRPVSAGRVPVSRWPAERREEAHKGRTAAATPAGNAVIVAAGAVHVQRVGQGGRPGGALRRGADRHVAGGHQQRRGGAPKRGRRRGH